MKTKLLQAILIGTLASYATSVQANDFFNFSSLGSEKAKPVPTDAAELLTLEPKENEMYPKISVDGKAMLVLAGKHKNYWISQRVIENGDPIHTVTDDLAALASVAWYGDDVTFLSGRTGMLGLWKKPANGEGLMRRVMELTGQLKDITLLQDGSIIATRLVMHGQDKHMHSQNTDNFNNWQVNGTRSYIVRIDKNANEKRLSEGTNPSISPDGKRIVFSMQLGRSMHLFIMNTDGSDLAEVTDGRSVDTQATWSPDGQWIVFTSNRSHADLREGKKDQWDIWAITADAKHLTQVTRDLARDGAPSVSAAGYIYFHSDRKLNKALKASHQVEGSVGKFHIWKIPMPFIQAPNKTKPA